jgi:hypothetical protein
VIAITVFFGFAIGWVSDDRSLRLPAPEEIPAGCQQGVLTLPESDDRERTILLAASCGSASVPGVSNRVNVG